VAKQLNVRYWIDVIRIFLRELIEAMSLVVGLGLLPLGAHYLFSLEKPRCGNSGAGGATCGGASANVNPIFQFDTSGRMLKTFGAGMFVSPHKLSVDKEGNLWLADNGGDQVFKLSQDGKV
jgi:hypothetical protein